MFVVGRLYQIYIQYIYDLTVFEESHFCVDARGIPLTCVPLHA